MPILIDKARAMLILELSQIELSTCETPEEGTYVVQFMDVRLKTPVDNNEDEYYTSYKLAKERFINVADEVAYRKRHHTHVFLIREIGTEWHLLELFKVEL
jgi:hypothetical protein